MTFRRLVSARQAKAAAEAEAVATAAPEEATAAEPETVAADGEDADTGADGEPRRGWWQRTFGGEVRFDYRFLNLFGDTRTKAEEFIEVSVHDTGHGMSPKVLQNLFVPFFTTKPGGSGVGLVLARQIVENHGGTLELRNREDARGCLVRVELPR